MKKIVLAALLASSFAAYAGPNLVVDGSFEDVAQAAGTYGIYNTINGWTTTSGAGIEVRNALVGTAFDGNNFVELDSDNNSGMAQTITTQAGASYTLSFEYSGRSGIPASSNPIEVLWNGVTVATVIADGTGLSNNAWMAYSYNLLGTGHDVLGFRASGTSDSLGGSLDAVSLVTAVPEPSTWAMMVAGFAFIGFSIRRRRAD